jgi:rRNA processing protein Krr1/Pno1
MSIILKLAVPNKLHKYCIGTGGSVIKNIQTTSNCQIKLNGDFIEITGTSSSTEIAKKEIFQVLSNVGWNFEKNKWIEKTKQDEFWKKYRKEAEKEVELRNECFEKSKTAFQQGKKELAKQLSGEAKKHEEKWKKLSQQAAELIFKEM